MNVYIVIPAFNEAVKIGEVIDSLREHGYSNIVVVDDCSTDLTSNVCMSRGVCVLTHIVNRGQGASLQTGTAYALSCGADFIVHFDADGQMRAEDIRRLLFEFDTGLYDVVIGSRFGVIKNEIPPLRRFLHMGIGFFNKIFLGISMEDPQSGFRVLSRRSSEVLEIKHDRMAHCSQLLQDMRFKGLRIKEVPVFIRYTKYSLSKGQRFTDAFKVAFELFLGKLIGK